MERNNLGMKGLAILSGLKLLALGIIFLAIMPPFSFAYLALGLLGLASCIKSVQCVRNHNEDLKYFLTFSLISFVMLLSVVV